MSSREDTSEELVLPPPDGAEWPSTSPKEAPTPPGRVVVLDPAAVLAPAETDGTSQVEMCCDGSGRTVAQHRAESADHSAVSTSELVVLRMP
jgi:hypothetical protein